MSSRGPQIIVESFSYKRGVPVAPVGALTVDLRGRAGGPAENRALAGRDGRDRAVIEHIAHARGTFTLAERTAAQAEALFASNTKKNLMARVQIGDEDGRQFSVGFAELLADTLRGRGYRVEVEHHHI